MQSSIDAGLRELEDATLDVEGIKRQIQDINARVERSEGRLQTAQGHLNDAPEGIPLLRQYLPRLKRLHETEALNRCGEDGVHPRRLFPVNKEDLMPMYEMSLQIEDRAQRHFIVHADNADDAHRRLRSIFELLGLEGAEAIGIIGGAERLHGTILEFADPSLGYFETEPV